MLSFIASHGVLLFAGSIIGTLTALLRPYLVQAVTAFGNLSPTTQHIIGLFLGTALVSGLQALGVTVPPECASAGTTGLSTACLTAVQGATLGSVVSAGFYAIVHVAQTAHATNVVAATSIASKP
jgi:hypothetical protein